MKLSTHVLAIAAGCFLFFSCNHTKTSDEHAPETSLADLTVAEGLEVTLFASEPMFSNPTNMDIDARGRIWICEAFNYRNQYNPKNPVRGEGDRIMILEDTDGDGVADKSKVFYQGTDVNAALGICVLGNKVIVSCSPNVFVFTDVDGDDVPDSKEILFQGIKGIQHDHAIHAFTFGPDGKLYFNMGNEGGVLIDPKGDTVTDVRGNKVFTNGKPYRDGLALRCDMSGANVEVLGHNFRNNYELTVDPYGTVWQSDNDDDGNQGTRINYVMQYGNFGYKDEVTGASWYARRTNMEKEIPFRHWHLNDPGVVPNVLQTGSGSPTGITLYEGNMLPEKFRGQLIHAEPGHNVVRSYAVMNDGAGYKATINNILQGNKDQWFRPADVTVAPDGSLFVADWYDPGVGGHQMGDPNRGRIYRIATPGSEYNIKSLDLNSPAGAMEALLSPNAATRYLGWQALSAFGEKAEAELLKLWRSKNQRHRAQALWLLTKLQGKSGRYLEEAASDKNPDIRITALRIARQNLSNDDVFKLMQLLIGNSERQMDRELALAHNDFTEEMPAVMWSRLALQHDGTDRWYLEALGIGAEHNWDLYFNTWKKEIGDKWNTPGGRDIIWRSRSAAAIPFLASLIKSSDDEQMLRYFRALDFHTDPSKQKVLADIVVQSKGAKVLYALKHMDPSKLTMTPAVRSALNKVLEEQKGKIEFVELVSLFKLENRSHELLQLGLQYPDSTVGKESVKVLLDWDKVKIIKDVLYADNKEKVQAMIKALWPHMYSQKAIALMEGFMLDSTRDLELRKLAIKTFGGPWESEDRLLLLAKEKKLPEDLHVSASGVFQNAWRATLRDEAAKYLSVPGKEGKPLPSISKLVDKKGKASNGKTIFASNCANCHMVNKEGSDFGPNLSEIGAKLSKEGLYNAIIYPDQGISFGFEAWRIKLNDGSTAFGRIISETEDKIEVKYMTNKQVVMKQDIASKTKLENSLMPSNLTSNMSEEELVDLVEYLLTLQKTSL